MKPKGLIRRIRGFMKKQSSQRGVALIVVLASLAILTVSTLEFNFRARVNLRMAANMRDELKAEMLAQSAINFTDLLLHLQRTIDQIVNKRFRMNIQIWQWVPLDSDLLRAFSGGVFGQQALAGSIIDQYSSIFGNDNEEENYIPPGSVAQAVPEDVKEKAAEVAEEKREEIAEKTGFGDFDGHFMSEISDEDSKICLNVSGAGEIKALAMQLKALFAPEELDFLFERRDEQGNYMSREEIIGALIDWVDPDNVKYGMEAGDENSLYEFLDDPYPVKNAYFDSLDEVQLVWGIDDRFWDIFRDAFTVYRPLGGVRTININTADPLVLEALLRQCTNTNPTNDQVHATLDQIMKYRDEETFGMGFANGRNFENIAKQYTQFDLSNGCLAKHARTESTIFRVKGTGEVGDVAITIETIMDKNGKLYYWRIY